MTDDAPFRRIAIAGTGLIGASIGLRARLHGAEVRGWDTSPAALSEAVARGAVDRGVAAFEDLIDGADLIVLATPLTATLDLLGRVPADIGGARILDVASIKVPVAAAGRRLRSFVPTHPMAGSERSGPSAARPDLFEGAVWAYVPAEAAATAAVQAWIFGLGAVPVPVDARAHDDAVALTSQLPQLASVALAQILRGRISDPLVASLCGPGVRSMTRLAGSSWEVWEGVLAHAGPALAQEVRTLCDVLAQVATELEASKSSSLAARFAVANRVADELRANERTSQYVGDPKSLQPREVL